MRLLKFFIFFPFLFFYSETSFSWGQMQGYNHYNYVGYPQAYSPYNPIPSCQSLEYRALFSRPGSSKTSKKSRVSKLEKKIKRYEGYYDKYEDRLEKYTKKLKNSLKNNAFKKSDGTSESKGTVAKAIKKYIQHKKDKWDCESGSGSSNLMFYYPNVFIFLKEALLPQAEAQTEAKTEAKAKPVSFADDTVNITVDHNCEPGSFEDAKGKCVKLTEKQKCIKKKGYSWNPFVGGGVCIKNPVPKTQRQKCIEKKGHGWNPNTRRCVKNPVPKTQRQKCVEKEGHGWNPNTRRCVKNPVLKAPVSEKPVLEKEEKTSLAGETREIAVDHNCKPGSFEDENGECKTEEQICVEKEGHSWDPGIKACVKNPVPKTKRQRCAERKGYSWNPHVGRNGVCVKSPVSKKADASSDSVSPLIYGYDGDSPDGNADVASPAATAPPNEDPSPKTKMQKCAEKSGYSWNPHVGRNGVCVKNPASTAADPVTPTTPPESASEEPADASSSVTPPPKCKKSKWKKDEYFGEEGEVSEEFCADYAKDVEACKLALKGIKRNSNKIDKNRRHLTHFNNQLSKLEDSDEDESETEAGINEPCWDCLKKVRKIMSPTRGQKLGHIATLLGGLALGHYASREGRRSTKEANRLRAWQGEPALASNHSLAGIGVAYPFISQAVYGLTNPRSSVCSPSVNPYGRQFGWR